MARTICTLKSSAVHYKVLAAGRTPAEEAFQYVAKVIRPKDVGAATQTIRVLPRYPVPPWEWDSVIPSFALPSALRL